MSRQLPKLMQNVVSNDDSSLKTEIWLNTKQAAEFLGITEGSLRNMVCLRKVRYFKRGSRNRYLLDDLRELITPALKEEISGN